MHSMQINLNLLFYDNMYCKCKKQLNTGCNNIYPFTRIMNLTWFPMRKQNKCRPYHMIKKGCNELMFQILA